MWQAGGEAGWGRLPEHTPASWDLHSCPWKECRRKPIDSQYKERPVADLEGRARQQAMHVRLFFQALAAWWLCGTLLASCEDTKTNMPRLRLSYKGNGDCLWRAAPDMPPAIVTGQFNSSSALSACWVIGLHPGQIGAVDQNLLSSGAKLKLPGRGPE